MELGGLLVTFALFLGLYQYLRTRAEHRDGQRPPVQWGWLAAIIVTVAIVLIVGAVIR